MVSYLLIGGVRSGKSAWAVNYAKKHERKTFIATAEPCDEDMEARIVVHQRERGEGWITIEAGKDIHGALNDASERSDCIVLDCLTVWTALIMNDAEHLNDIIENWVQPVTNLIKSIESDLLIVTNETGMGVHPEYESGRRYRDLLGLVNQKFAQACDNVLLFVAGIPTAIKGELPGC